MGIHEIATYIACISVIGVTILYTLAAPWWKSVTGLSFFGVLSSFTALAVEVILSAIAEYKYEDEVETAIYLYISIAMISVGVAIVKAQLVHRQENKPKHSRTHTKER